MTFKTGSKDVCRSLPVGVTLSCAKVLGDQNQVKDTQKEQLKQ